MPEMESTDSELPKTLTEIGPMLCQTSDLVIMENLQKTQNTIIEIGESTL